MCGADHGRASDTSASVFGHARRDAPGSPSRPDLPSTMSIARVPYRRHATSPARQRAHPHRRGERAGQIGRRPQMSGQPMPPPADVHAMRPHESPAPPKGTIAGTLDKPPERKGRGATCRPTAHTPGPLRQYAEAYIDWAPPGSESRFVSPREPEVTDRPTPQGAVRSAPRRCPSSLASTTSGGLFRAHRSHQQSARTPHPEEREPRPRRIA